MRFRLVEGNIYLLVSISNFLKWKENHGLISIIIAISLIIVCDALLINSFLINRKDWNFFWGTSNSNSLLFIYFLFFLFFSNLRKIINYKLIFILTKLIIIEKCFNVVWNWIVPSNLKKIKLGSLQELIYLKLEE